MRLVSDILNYLKRTDKLLLILCLSCSLLSAIALYSIGVNYDDGSRRAIVQLGSAVIGVIAALFISTLDYRRIAAAWFIHAPISWGLVLLTFVIGFAPPGTDNKAWIDLFAGLSLQPTELSKISFILTLALHLSLVGERINEPKNIVRLGAHVLIPAALIHFQGDDGTMVVFVLIALTMIFAAGISAKYIYAALGAVVAAAPFAWYFLLGTYQKERILALFNPEKYPGVIWQQVQGQISIGAGGIKGIGFFADTHHTVPLMYNDFIFSYIAESIGLIGSIVLIALLFGIAIRALYISRICTDSLGAYICIGIFGMVIFQSLINIGVNLSLLPVIGITLPFVSAGGTSVLTMYIGIGILLSVIMHNRRTLFDG